MTSWPALFVSGWLVVAGGACKKDKGAKQGEISAPGVAAPANMPATSAPSPAGVPQKDGAEGLKAWFAASHKHCDAKDFATGKAQTMSAIPSRPHMKKLFKAEVADATIDKLMDFYKELPPSDEQAACIFTPGQGRTEITVHASTVADLAAYKEGTPAFNEFPGGAKDIAEKALQPGTTFYEVEVTEPGKDSGTKFHMFFWDGQQWRMLGPVWRAFR